MPCSESTRSLTALMSAPDMTIVPPGSGYFTNILTRIIAVASRAQSELPAEIADLLQPPDLTTWAARPRLCLDVGWHFVMESPMNRTHADNGTRGRRAGARAIRIVASLAALVMAGAGVANVALAQNNPPPRSDMPALDGQRTDSQSRMQAPIGHRQPRPQDLPSNALRDQEGRTDAQRELDKKLEICKGC